MRSLSSSPGAAVALLALIVGAAIGCNSTLPSIFLTMEDPAQLNPTQLRVHVRVDGQDTVTVTRPELPGAPLSGAQTMRLLMPDAAIETLARLSVEALVEGEVVGTAETVVRLAAELETAASVALVPGARCVGPDCTCDATTCPTGCCDGDACVQGDVTACGTGGGACTACNAEGADACIEGACRCGPDAPCPDGYACEAGRCAETGLAPPCSSEADCTTPPSQCHVAQGTCGEDARCVYALEPADTDCEDGNSCTTGDACDPTGLCVGTPMTCAAGTGCNEPTEGVCVQGACQFQPKAAGTACIDSDPCTSDTVCDGAGGCGGGSTQTCQSPPEGGCYEPAGSCNEAGDCTYQPKAQGTSCGVDTACVTYTCDGGGVCIGLTKAPGTVCGENTFCRSQTCDAQGSCVTNTQQDGQSCGSSGECSSRSCQAGVCVTAVATNGTACGVSDFCKTSSCLNGNCQVMPKNVGLSCAPGFSGVLPPPMGCGTCNSNGYCEESCGMGQVCCGTYCGTSPCSLEP